MRHASIRHQTQQQIEDGLARKAKNQERAAAKHAEGCKATKTGWPFCAYCGRDVRMAK
jgi:hypothetical protein